MRKGAVPAAILQDVVDAIFCKFCAAEAGMPCYGVSVLYLPLYQIHDARKESFIRMKVQKAVQIHNLTRTNTRLTRRSDK